METKEIDAQGKILGRLATEVAIILRGKNKVDFAPNRLPDLQVLVYNLSGLKFSGDKLNQKIYYRPKLMAKNPSSVFRKAVFNMLPKNRLRNRALARLILKNNAKDK
ncbi:uL13 family ribosomal protein [Candidatus Berkelbacteria bacterium]|nr:uL13 family ribosomal protein [Candidatus Berkelbacteria bacterium]